MHGFVYVRGPQGIATVQAEVRKWPWVPHYDRYSVVWLGGGGGGMWEPQVKQPEIFSDRMQAANFRIKRL